MDVVYKKVEENSPDIDTTVNCDCGFSFYMLVPGVVYKCQCGQMYRGKIVVERLEPDATLEQAFFLIGAEANAQEKFEKLMKEKLGELWKKAEENKKSKESKKVIKGEKGKA